MKIEPNLKDWAEALIHGITGDESYNFKLVKWVEAELNDIADKYYQMGFEDGDEDGWWTEQDKDIASIDTLYDEVIIKGKDNAIKQVIKNLKREFPNGWRQDDE